MCDDARSQTDTWIFCRVRWPMVIETRGMPADWSVLLLNAEDQVAIDRSSLSSTKAFLSESFGWKTDNQHARKNRSDFE